ncbi:Plasmid transfer protein TraF [Nitrosomonas mobilis]|uniref:Plasmid transfer protein TraF n=2 Tax=Nitrosomonas mobilis TaxID=51642 RepID=A0A1G5SGU5_9PROT|nr:Plasmid transfer protein TraF [Nitrosomonas mobilis]
MKRMLNTLAGLVLFMSAGIFLSAVVCRAAGIYYNHTPSFPVGFYKIIDAPVGKGAYVSFCPPQAKVFDIAMARQTIDRGNCPGGYGMLLKRVFAQRGDTVSIEAAGITVNEDLLPNSAQISGLELPPYRMEQKMLDDSEYLLMSDVNPYSFDARYFGLIAHAQIQHVVEPLFTWGD